MNWCCLFSMADICLYFSHGNTFSAAYSVLKTESGSSEVQFSTLQTATGGRPLLAHYPFVNQTYSLHLQCGRGENRTEENMDSELRLCNLISGCKTIVQPDLGS